MAENNTKLTLLVLHNRPFKSLKFKKNKTLLINSPYGQNINLQYFQTIILAAYRAGILRVLSIARNL